MSSSEVSGAYTAAAVRAAEAPLLAAGEPLMLEAAAALAEIARDVLAKHPGRVLVLAGAGDNGGDALFAAAELAPLAPVEIVLTSDRVHREALSTALGAGAELRHAADVCSCPGEYSVILDGILGIGAVPDPRLRGAARAVVESLAPVSAASGTTVIAVDLPSGLHPDDGTADSAVLPASITVTFGAVKAGLVRGRGPAVVGEIRVVDLGLEPALARVRPAVTGVLDVVRLPRRARV
ncbi:NAD(P)H-hydrate epimerase [Microbacterium sp. Gd 4-13]|uniref:NAD(P)H-hydrate epimerase n=1 Tax=Microbacterium sp. Gd 4-13 TaxID=2173179 RepID=UPI000D580AE5|nr:NAD(P)H-hydrate epimerase [Microbacterium sp. Gd 4-13]PVW02549.1 NAD(P)H-hydrate epimerase [Microbacterium sp. Gd 4-13]